MPLQNRIELGVLIGRFQPFHNGHLSVLQQALEQAREVVIVLGSSLQARDAKDPFVWQERAAMIGACLTDDQRSRVKYLPLRDYYDDHAWVAAVTAGVENLAGKRQTALFGHAKDASSYYLQRFPQWEWIALERQGDIDATAIRKILFECEHDKALAALLETLVPAPIQHYLVGWKALPHYAGLQEENDAVVESRKKYGSGPFVTADAIVRADDHVLLVRRGRAPGKGLLAIPGGFLEDRERIAQTAIRELREETGLALLESELEAALHEVVVFDHPDRSIRGRTITHAHFFELKGSRLPEVQGGDDAASAKWWRITDLVGLEEQLFEDHFHILNRFLKLVA